MGTGTSGDSDADLLSPKGTARGGTGQLGGAEAWTFFPARVGSQAAAHTAASMRCPRGDPPGSPRDGASAFQWYDLDALEQSPFPLGYDSSITPFQKLLILRCFRVDRVYRAVTDYVTVTMGEK